MFLPRTRCAQIKDCHLPFLTSVMVLLCFIIPQYQVHSFILTFSSTASPPLHLFLFSELAHYFTTCERIPQSKLFSENCFLFSNQKHAFVSWSCDTGMFMIVGEPKVSFMDWKVSRLLVTSASK